MNKMPDLQQNTFQKRQIAHKVRIFDILNGALVRDDLSAGYIKLNDVNISRVNIIATIVYKPEEHNYTSAVIDDGTGRIQLRTFENKSIFLNVDVGDVILMIGKIREFNNEKYILPEILKKINNVEWMNVRKLELEKSSNTVSIVVNAPDKNIIEDVDVNINEEVYSLIRKLDKGDGVTIEDVIKNSKNCEAENIINKLLERGDIFEIGPGKLKVLE